MRIIQYCCLLFTCQVAFADICPDLSHFADDNQVPSGWTIMKPHASNANATFKMAIYQQDGMFPHQIYCNYTNGGADYPLILLSDNKYVDPNPNNVEKSPWQYQNNQYNQKVCTVGRPNCRFLRESTPSDETG